MTPLTPLFDAMKAQHETIQKAYDAGIDLINFLDTHARTESILGELAFGEHYDLITQFAYEWDYGEKLSKDNPGMTDHDGTPLVWDEESLWEYIKKESPPI